MEFVINKRSIHTGLYIHNVVLNIRCITNYSTYTRGPHYSDVDTLHCVYQIKQQ